MAMTMTGEIKLAAPARIAGEGEGGIAGFAKGGAKVELASISAFEFVT